MSWEETFISWGKPPSQSEQDKCDNAVRAVRKAISASSALQDRNITVFAQGSYCNRTNVKAESDVDICVLCRDTLINDYPEGMAREDFGLRPATYYFRDYKNDVEKALIKYFGTNTVIRGNKAFDVHANTYRVDADVVACFEHRRYQEDGDYLEGTAFYTDDGIQINNWPKQHYENGVRKNKETSYRFKSIVRILKQIRYNMTDVGIVIAKDFPSYLIECLVWNVPNEGFDHDTYTADIRWALAHLYNETKGYDKCKEWGEINELKYLFRSSQPWTIEQTHSFIDAAWKHIGFE